MGEVVGHWFDLADGGYGDVCAKSSPSGFRQRSGLDLLPVSVRDDWSNLLGVRGSV